MTTSFDDIERLSKALSAEDRARLAESLLESIQPQLSAEVAAAWQAAVTERIADCNRGEMEIYGAADVFLDAQRLIDRRS